MRPPLPGPAQLNHVLEQAYSSWTFNAFALDEASRGRPLSVLSYFLLHRLGLIKTLGLKPIKVARFLQALESSYMDNPYHCRIHAADVLQTFHVIITRGGFTHAYVDPIRHLACIIAAAAHDVEHEGEPRPPTVWGRAKPQLRVARGLHAACSQAPMPCGGATRRVDE